MGDDPITRGVTAAATMGLSETVRAGVDLVSGKDPIKSLTNAATLGAAEIGGDIQKQIGGDLMPASVQNMPSMDDVKQAVAKVTSDTENPLDKMKKRARTLLTGGLGVPGDASVTRKTLLGV